MRRRLSIFLVACLCFTSIQFPISKTVVDAAALLGGEFFIDEEDTAKAVWGDSATVEVSGEVMTITLNSDVTLKDSLSIGGRGDNLQLNLNLNGHTIAGASGAHYGDYNTSLGKDAILLNGEMKLNINGPGKIVGGKGGVILDNVYGIYGRPGGDAVKINYSGIMPTGVIGNTITVDKGAQLIGGAGGDITYADYVENTNIVKDSISDATSADRKFGCNAGAGGDGISDSTYEGNGNQNFTFATIRLVSGTVCGGAGGEFIIGDNSTSYKSIIALDAVKEYAKNQDYFYFAKVQFKGGEGGNGITLDTGRKYLDVEANAIVRGGAGGAVSSSKSSAMDNRAFRKMGNGGTGVYILGDIGYTNAVLDLKKINKSDVDKKDSPLVGVYIAGSIYGGNGAGGIGRKIEAGRGGDAILSDSHYVNYLYNPTDGAADMSRGAIYIAATGKVQGGNGGQSYIGTAGYGGNGFENSSKILNRNQDCVTTLVVDGILAGGDGGASRCGAKNGNAYNVNTNYGVCDAGFMDNQVANAGEVAYEGQAFYFSGDVDTTIFGTGTIKGGNAGATYRAFDDDAAALTGDYVSDVYRGYDNSRFSDIKKSFSGTITRTAIANSSLQKKVSKTAKATIKAEGGALEATAGQKITCSVSGGSGEAYYDWRYVDERYRRNDSKPEMDMHGQGSYCIVTADIAREINAYIDMYQKPVEMYCYVLYENGVTVKSNVLKFSKGEDSGNEDDDSDVDPSLPGVNGVTILDITSKGATISWIAPKDISGIDGYKLMRSTSSNSGYELLTTVAKSEKLEYIDTTCKPQTTYYIRVYTYKGSYLNQSPVQLSYTTGKAPADGECDHVCNVTSRTATTEADGYYKEVCALCGKVIADVTYYKASKLSISSTSFTHNGKVRAPKVTVQNSKGKAINKNYYDLVFSNGKSKKIGEYSVTVVFKDRYSGKKKFTYKIIPNTPKKLDVTRNGKKLYVFWEFSNDDINGYEIRYSTKSSMKKAKTVTVKNKYAGTKTIKLPAAKKYYVQIRAYKKIGNKKLYSKWSKKVS